MIRIDAHQHFWNPARGDYGWMPKDDPTLYRSYGPDDLRPHLAAQDITHTVLVQAAPTLEETEYMLGLADASDLVAGVVGWVDFERPDQRSQLERLSAHPKFKGVRPMIQDIPDVDWMLRDDVQWGFQAVCDLGLRFDALGFARHLQNFETIFRRYPDMPVVIDHFMKPQIAVHTCDRFSEWADGMARLAETGAFCKLSGLITEASESWLVEDIRPYSNHILKVFGPRRVMWGSDWPVCRLRAEYDAWFRAARGLTDHLDDSELARIFGGTAIEFYGLTT